MHDTGGNEREGTRRKLVLGLFVERVVHRACDHGHPHLGAVRVARELVTGLEARKRHVGALIRIADDRREEDLRLHLDPLDRLGRQEQCLLFRK
jgi:hypothetical protein